MEKVKIIKLTFIILIGYGVQAQTKKWTLEECVKHALEHNITIKQTELNTKNADIDKKQAKGNFLPSINLSSSHSWNIGLNQDITTGLFVNQTTQNTSLGGSTNIDIYKGLQNVNNLRKANLSIVSAKYQLVKMKEDIALNVANAFLQVLFNKENLVIQNEQLEINKKQLERSKELVGAGQIPKGDLLDIEATIATGNQNVIIAENQLLLSKLSLVQLLQLESVENFDISNENNGVEEKNEVLLQTAETIYKKAIETRTELKIAQSNLDIAINDIKIAKGGFQPSLSGFYNFNSRVTNVERPVYDKDGRLIGVTSANPFLIQFNDNKGHSFGLQLNIPILNGFTVKNNVERIKVALERSKNDLEQQKIDIQRSVFTAFTDTKGALKAHESAQAALKARQLAYDYSIERYNVGLLNSFELNQSQTLLANAKSEVIRSKFDYIFKTKILEFYFGIPIAVIK